jgi:hypothetical protein
MTRGEKRWLTILAVVTVVSVPFMPFWGSWQQSGGDSGDDDPSGELDQQPERASELTRIPPLNLDLLAGRTDSFSRDHRNLFSFPGSGASSYDDAEEEEEEGWEEEELEQTANQDAQAAENPRLTDYELIGIVQVDELVIAVFSWRGEEQFQGSVGSVINDTFEIKEIGEDYVRIFITKGGFQQRLKLKPPVSEGG